MSYLCIDGGQTRTAVYLLATDGTRLAHWEEKPLVTPSRPDGIQRFRSVIHDVCVHLQQQLASTNNELPQVFCFSLTGYLDNDERIPPLVEEEVQRVFPQGIHLVTIPDYIGNWAAATGGHPGVVVISGGGTIAYGQNANGASIRVGGWGHLLGDEGSGYWIGMQAIKAALQSYAGIIPHSVLETQLFRKYQITNDRQMLHLVYAQEITDVEIAQLVPLVIESALHGDDAASRLLDEAASHLAGTARSVIRTLGEMPVFLSGGVFQAPTMPERFKQQFSITHGSVPVCAVHTDPCAGIFTIARTALSRRESQETTEHGEL